MRYGVFKNTTIFLNVHQGTWSIWSLVLMQSECFISYTNGFTPLFWREDQSGPVAFQSGSDEFQSWPDEKNQIALGMFGIRIFDIGIPGKLCRYYRYTVEIIPILSVYYF